ncbi:hypothetical protein BH23BAC1_BH23BAC1_19940 [soil metagenome]
MKQFGSLFFALVILNQVYAQQKKIYLAIDDHTDYMWTANEAEYDSAFVNMLDYYLDQIDATNSNPPDFQSRFNCDGSYWIKVYQKYRSPEQYERLINSIRSGHISSPLNFLVSTYGGQPTEAVLRGMYHAGQLEREHNLRFKLAVSMENQTLPLGLSSLWAGSGAKYSWKGVCGCASRISNETLSDRRHQIYHYTGQDSRSVIMKWYNLGIDNYRLGGYAEARGVQKPVDPITEICSIVEDLDDMCQTSTKDAGYPYHIAGAFGYGWDDLETYISPEFITSAQKSTNESRAVRISNQEDFFEEVESHYPDLPKESVSYGNEWDTYPVSMNETTARVRRATEKLRSAEGLYSLVSLKNKDFATNLNSLRSLAWESYGLYWEHDWTADGPITQKERAEWQIKICNQITAYTDTLFNLSKAELGNIIKASSASQFYVFNPLSWTRNDVADFPYENKLPVKVIDLTTKKEVASQVILKEGKQHIRIWAEEIPSVGYKVFEIRQGKPKTFPQAANFSGNYMSNAYHRIRLQKSGVITELFDLKASNRQLVKSVEGKYVNDLGQTDLDQGEELVIENAGPVSVTLKAVSSNPVKHEVKVTMFANSPRIEIENHIQENFKDLKTWAFSFDLDNPTTHHEELGAILTAKKETSGGDYASQNARYDWQTFNHFAHISEAEYGITLSNLDCSFFKLGNSSPDSLWEQSSQINALAGGQTDPKLGINNQFGAESFRYHFAITTHSAAFDPVSSMKFSLEDQNPLVSSQIKGKPDAGPLHSSPKFSLLNINDPSVLLWSLKPSEEGIQQGLIARFWNLNKMEVDPEISLAQPILEAWHTSHIETNEMELQPDSGRLSVKFSPLQLNTYRLFPEK